MQSHELGYPKVFKPGHQSLLKASTQGQALKIAWKFHPLQAFVEGISQGQVLQAAGPPNALQVLVKIVAKSHVL